ncbi:MAG: DUF1552 domain-containing protein [Pirellulaceae bacterium]
MSRNRGISRRAVLRGVGAAIGLPLLEALWPATARAARLSADKPPVRMAFFYVPNGMHMPHWTPKTIGNDFEITPTLQPLAPYRSHMTLLSGLTLNGARALGDGGGDHARSAAAFLTGAHPKKTDGADICNGVSVDQMAASKIGRQTRLPSLELGLERGAKAGNCDSGYSCAYTSNLSWRSPESPVAKEVDPTAVFDRLFGDAMADASLQQRTKRDHYKTSVLDLVLEDAQDLQRKLSGTDRHKLEEYLYAVRDIERRLENSGKLRNAEAGVPDYPRPSGVPQEYEQHARLMFDLMTLAIQTDSTRILTFMFTNEGSNRSYPQIGISDGHHELSHHGNDQAKQTKISQINLHHMSMFAYFIDKLATTSEGNGTLLDNCMVLYGSGIGDGNAHNHDDLPLVLMGRGGGTITSRRHLAYADETPLTNLYLAMLERVGAPAASLGDSTGPLPDLGEMVG